MPTGCDFFGRRSRYIPPDQKTYTLAPVSFSVCEGPLGLGLRFSVRGLTNFLRLEVRPARSALSTIAGSMRLPEPAAPSVGQFTGHNRHGGGLELFSRMTAFVFFGSRKPKGSLMLMLVFFLFFGPPSRMPGKEEFIIQLSYFVACSSPLLFAA